MPDISGIAALDVLIGLFFVYFVLSIVCSSVNEAIASALALRAKELKRGVRNLLASDAAVERFYSQWRIRALVKPATKVFGERPPSYIPSRAFALTVLDTFAPPADDASSRDLVARAEAAVDRVDIPVVQGLLRDALAEARGDIDRFRDALERSFDEVMDRVSGWYKRRVQLMIFVIALAVVGASNADSFAIGERLWKDDALRAAVVAQVGERTAGRCPDQSDPEGPAMERAVECVDEVEELGIPLGWTSDTTPSNAWESLGKALGLLVTAFALSFGAPFWFDVLSKVSRLRATGRRERAEEKK